MAQFTSSLDYRYNEQDTDPDILYYNANIVNQNSLTQSVLGQEPVVRFQETRSTSLLDDISDYQFSIVRFTMNGAGRLLPLFIPSVQLDGGDINLTTYSFTIDWKNSTPISFGGHSVPINFSAQTFIKFVSQFQIAYTLQNVKLPNLPTTANGQDIRGYYYWVQSYQWWLDLINSSLTATYSTATGVNSYYPTGSIAYQFNQAWKTAGGTHYASLSAFPTAGSGNVGVVALADDTGIFYTSTNNSGTYSWVLTPSPANTQTAPQMLYDGNLFQIVFPNTFLQVNAQASTPDSQQVLFFNNNMWGLFSNFNFTNYNQEATGKSYQIICENTGNNANADKSLYTMTQEYNSTSQIWSPIESIVFTSTLIPIFAEQVGAPNVYGEGNDSSSTNTSTSAFTPIITDIALTQQTASDYRDFIGYTPTAEYRLASFTRSHQELRSIDVQVFWKARLTGELIPIRLFNGSSVGLKIMFRKRMYGKQRVVE